MREEGLQVDYERLPVTDEQAPIPGVYTRIEERVSNALKHNPDDTGLVFNCQMVRLTALSSDGSLNNTPLHTRAEAERQLACERWPSRARSPSPLADLFLVCRVAAALVSNILFNHVAVYDLSASFVGERDNDSVSLSWDGRESDPYLAGEYKAVLQLVGVLQYGKMAKKLTDRAIDMCEGGLRAPLQKATTTDSALFHRRAKPPQGRL